jgi:hypothetical protein
VLLAEDHGRRDALLRLLSSGRTLRVPTLDIAAAHYVEGACHRLDLYVRLLALEQWAGLNNFGVGLYERFMRLKSDAQGRAETSHTSEGLRQLFASIESCGFRADFPIVVRSDKVLRHGMHRLACATFLDLKTVPIRVQAGFGRRPDYTLARLQELRLDASEIDAITQAESRYLEKWFPEVGPSRCRAPQSAPQELS